MKKGGLMAKVHSRRSNDELSKDHYMSKCPQVKIPLEQPLDTLQAKIVPT